MLRSYFSRFTVIAVLVLCVLLGISIWFGKTTASSEQFHKGSIDYLEEKRDNAKALSAAASASSVIISMLPEDTATPVANQIADIGTHFLIVLSALTAEQNLLMITGEISFCWLIPIALAFLIIFAIVQRKLFLQVGVKLLICAVSIFLAVPLTIQITRMADTSYQEAVDETLAESQALEDAVNGNRPDNAAGTEALSEENAQGESGAGVSGSGEGSESTGKKGSVEASSENVNEETETSAAGAKEEKDASSESVKEETETSAADAKEAAEASGGKKGKKETEVPEEEKPWHEAAWDAITDTVNMAGDTAQGVIDDGTDFVSDTAQSLASGASDAAEDFVNGVNDTAESFVNGVTETADSFVEGVNYAADSTVSFVESLPELPEKAALLLDSFTEAFVIMMVTTCVLPVIVLLGCILIMNMLLNIDPDWDGAKLYRSARKSSGS